MRRKNRFETYKEAVNRASYDEFPMLELGIDPQLHLSRNTVAQPFYLICHQDSIIAQMAGEARVEFRRSAVNYVDLALGDFVYVPGGTPHRIVPRTESIHLRYKACRPGLEAVAWYSSIADEEIARVTWNCAGELPQEAYLRACRAFNADPAMRTSRRTGEILPLIDLAPFRWAEVAAEIREAETFERARAQKKAAAQAEPEPEGLGHETIARPNDDKVPLKVNIYDYARTATTALSPMFPYFDAGSIVPCIALQDPGHRGAMGYFVHYNTVQEVNVCFGSSGSFRVAGGVSVGPNTHPVGDKPGQPSNPDMFYIGVITQRQSVGSPQKEAIIFHCEQCGEEIFRRDYDAHEFPDRLDGPANAQLIGLPTISQSAVAAEAFNRSEASRACSKCGHVNSPFPTAYWGWDDYRRRTAIAVAARKLMSDAAAGDIATPA